MEKISRPNDELAEVCVILVRRFPVGKLVNDFARLMMMPVFLEYEGKEVDVSMGCKYGTLAKEVLTPSFKSEISGVDVDNFT